jgi:ABC-type branched-subunit amino acid transport system ATPase component
VSILMIEQNARSALQISDFGIGGATTETAA